MLEAVLGGLSFLIHAAIESDDVKILDEFFVTKYGEEDSGLDAAIDHLQQEYSCCGSQSFEDWVSSEWRSRQSILKVPDSCCKSMSLGCGKRDHPSNIAYTGCLSRVSEMIVKTLVLITMKSILMCIIEGIGLILSICYLSLCNKNTKKMKEKKKPVMIQGYWRTK